MAMMRGVPLMLTAVLSGCAGRALATAGSATTPMAAPEVYTCVQQQIKAAGFSQESHDDEARRVVGRKYDTTVRRPDTQFRRLVDRVTFTVGQSGGDTVATTLNASASTFAELMTHRGPTEQQEKTSETAKEAARTILARCTSSR